MLHVSFSNHVNEQSYIYQLTHSTFTGKLNTDSNGIEKLIETIAGLMLESVRLKITQSIFVSSIQPILLEQAKVLKIWDKIDLTRDLIIQILSKTDINFVKFSSLNWRLEHTVNKFMLNNFSLIW